MNLHDIFTEDFKSILDAFYEVLDFPFIIRDVSEKVTYRSTRLVPPRFKKIEKKISDNNTHLGQIIGFYESGSDRKRISLSVKLLHDLITEKRRSRKAFLSAIKDVELRDEELTYFYKICDSLTSVVDIKKVCSIVLEMVVRIVNVERASLLLIDKKSRELKIFASRGIPKNIAKSVTVKLGEGISGKVAATGKHILVENVDTHDKDELINGSTFSTKSFLSYPLVYSRSKNKKDVIGVINATDKKSGQIFTTEDLRLVSAVAALATMALQNAEFYNRLMTAFTELKEKNKILVNAQKALIRSERIASLGTFSASVAHEIKNPLTAIMGVVQMLSVKKDSPEEIEKYAKTIYTQVDFISRIVTELLDFSRTGIPERNEEDINQVIEDTLVFTEHHLVRFKDIKVKKNLKKNLPKISIDKGQIQQVFINLIHNAEQAMPEGGVLTIKSYILKQSGDRDEGKEDYVTVSFTDTGTGIEKDDLDNIFKSFFTTKKKGEGTGLGLWIAQNIIKNHNGLLIVRSRKNHGSCFEVRLPV